MFWHVDGEHVVIGRRPYWLAMTDDVDNPLQKGHASEVILQTALRNGHVLPHNFFELLRGYFQQMDILLFFGLQSLLVAHQVLLHIW